MQRCRHLPGWHTQISMQSCLVGLSQAAGLLHCSPLPGSIDSAIEQWVMVALYARMLCCACPSDIIDGRLPVEYWPGYRECSPCRSWPWTPKSRVEGSAHAGLTWPLAGGRVFLRRSAGNLGWLGRHSRAAVPTPVTMPLMGSYNNTYPIISILIALTTTLCPCFSVCYSSLAHRMSSQG